MARQMGLEKTLNELSVLPWWLLLIIAPITYYGIQFGIPLIKPENPVAAGLIPVFTAFAWVPALVLVMAAIGSFFKALNRSQLIESQQSIESIRALTWQEFEKLVGEAFRRQGYSVAETGQAGPDGGVDVTLRKNCETVYVQCKHWRTGSIGVQTVRELLGAITAGSATSGIVVGSGTFTKAAVGFARENNIELIDGEVLMEMVSSVQTPSRTPQRISKQPMQITEVAANSDDVACPKCGSGMIERLAKRGANAGKRFLGCSCYPKCRGTRQVA